MPHSEDDTEQGNKRRKLGQCTLRAPDGWSAQVDVGLLNRGGALNSDVHDRLYGFKTETVKDGDETFETRARVGGHGVHESESVYAIEMPGRFKADATYFVVNERRLMELRVDGDVSIVNLSGDGETSFVTVQIDRDNGTSVVTVRNVGTGAQLQHFDYDKRVTDCYLSRDGSTVTIEHERECGVRVLTVHSVDTGAQVDQFERPKYPFPKNWSLLQSSTSYDGKTSIVVLNGGPQHSRVIIENGFAPWRLSQGCCSSPRQHAE